MNQYTITWTIELSAKNPKEAAKEALDCIINGTSKYFMVIDEKTKVKTEIDLNEHPVS